MQSFVELDMGSNKIVSLADGTAAQDAVTKAQLDAATGGFDGAHSSLTGITTSDHHVKYTDGEAQSANVGLWLSIGGGTLTGALNIDGVSPQRLTLRATTEANYIKFQPTGSNAFVGTSDSAGGGLLGGAGAYSLVAVTEGAANLALGVGNALKVLLNATTGDIEFKDILDMGGFDINDAGKVFADDFQFIGSTGAIKDGGGQNRVILQDDGYFRFLKANGTGIFMEWDEVNAQLEINDNSVFASLLTIEQTSVGMLNMIRSDLQTDNSQVNLRVNTSGMTVRTGSPDGTTIPLADRFRVSNDRSYFRNMDAIDIYNIDNQQSGFIEGFPGANREVFRFGAGTDSGVGNGLFMQFIGPGDTSEEQFAVRFSDGTSQPINATVNRGPFSQVTTPSTAPGSGNWRNVSHSGSAPSGGIDGDVHYVI